MNEIKNEKLKLTKDIVKKFADYKVKHQGWSIFYSVLSHFSGYNTNKNYSPKEYLLSKSNNKEELELLQLLEKINPTDRMWLRNKADDMAYIELREKYENEIREEFIKRQSLINENIKQPIEKRVVSAAKRIYKNHQGTEFLDRTIYHGVEVTDSKGNVLKDPYGNPRVEPRVYRLVGSWLSREALAKALEIEEQFQELNNEYRKDMEVNGIPWRIKVSEIRAISIPGIV